jgi:hypothetical protein
MPEELKVLMIETIVQSQNEQILKLQDKLSRIEALLLQQVYCEYIQQSVTKQIHKIIEED